MISIVPDLDVVGIDLRMTSLLRKPMDCRSWFLEIRRVFGRAAFGLSSMERRGGVLEFMGFASN